MDEQQIEPKLITALESYRRQKKLTSRAFARLLGVDETFYHALRRGVARYNPMRTLAAISYTLPQFNALVLEYMCEYHLARTAQGQQATVNNYHKVGNSSLVIFPAQTQRKPRTVRQFRSKLSKKLKAKPAPQSQARAQ